MRLHAPDEACISTTFEADTGLPNEKTSHGEPDPQMYQIDSRNIRIGSRGYCAAAPMSRPDRERSAGSGMLDTIARALLSELPQTLQPATQDALPAVQAYLARALSIAPWHIRLLERSARPVVWIWLSPLRGTPMGFARLGGPFASFIRLYRSLAMVAFAESDAALALMGGERVPDRQDRFRVLRHQTIGTAMADPDICPDSRCLERPGTLNCDVLIIGSGPGGAAVAEVTSQAGLDVLMLEEGPYRPASRAPASLADAFLETWRGAGLTPALGPVPVAYAEGRCVGGGSEINSAIFQRPPDDIVQEWARAFRIDDMTPDSLRPYYDRATAAVNASVTPGALGPASEILRRGAEAMGWKVSPLERAQRACVGTNLCSFVCPTGGKQSMSSTLLPQAQARGARLIAEARVVRLILENNQARGAEAMVRIAGGIETQVRVEAKRVFICAGAVQTPALLRGSGLTGPIGNTLRLHPTIKVQALFDEPVRASDSRLPLYAITEFMPDIRLGGSVSRPGVHAMGVAEDWEARRHLLTEEAHVGAYYAMVRGRGIGKVRATRFGRDPLVYYRLSSQDWDRLRQGLKYLAQAMFAAGARTVYPSLRGHPGWNRVREAEVELEAPLPHKRANLMTIHLFSSCPLGNDLARCPVDSFGAVRGVAGLHVADASLIPTAPGVNPQASVMALAYRCAEYALQDRTATRCR